MKRMNILKSKKGLTLVELIIGMVVLSIILIMVSAILVPTLQFQRRANELAEQNALLDTLANQIVYDLSRAIEPISAGDVFPLKVELFPGGDSIKIPIGVDGGGNVIYSVSAEGVIFREVVGVNDAQPLLPGDFHKRMNQLGVRVTSLSLVDISIITNEVIYELTIKLGNDNTIFHRPYVVRPLGLNQY